MAGIPKIVRVPIMIGKKVVGRTKDKSFYILEGGFLTEKETTGLLCEAEVRDTLGISEEKIFIFEDIKSIQMLVR